MCVKRTLNEAINFNGLEICNKKRTNERMRSEYNADDL